MGNSGKIIYRWGFLSKPCLITSVPIDLFAQEYVYIYIMCICIWNYDVPSSSCDWSDVQPSLHFFSGDASATHRSLSSSVRQAYTNFGFVGDIACAMVWCGRLVVNQPTAIPCGSVVRLLDLRPRLTFSEHMPHIFVG